MGLCVNDAISRGSVMMRKPLGLRNFIFERFELSRVLVPDKSNFGDGSMYLLM